MMGFAAMLAAHKHGRIQIVYRDRDAKGFELQLIERQYDGYKNDVVPINRAPNQNCIDWEKLFRPGENIEKFCDILKKMN